MTFESQDVESKHEGTEFSAKRESVLAATTRTPPEPSPAPVRPHPRCEDLGCPREIEIPAAHKGICMWLLWKLLQSGSACSTGVKKVEVIVLHLVGIVCMTQE